MPESMKCACLKCYCTVTPDKACMRDGKMYCSKTCAYECTESTCLCVHDRCDPPR